MKRKEIKALHDLSLAELNKKLTDLTMDVAKAKLEKKVGKLANVRMVSTLGDDIARIKTIMHKKEMEAA